MAGAPALTEADSSELIVTKDRILLVEGGDDKNFCIAVAATEGVLDLIQVIDIGGDTRFDARLTVVRNDAQARGILLRSIGLAGDADRDAADRITGLQATLRRHSLPVPAGHAQFAAGSPSTGIFVYPDGTSAGAIEDLCLASVQGSPAMPCIDEFIACLTGVGEFPSNNLSKSRVRAFLASRERPQSSLGVGARAGYFPMASAAFAPIRTFVRQLATA